MIKFTLPNFFDVFRINQFFIYLSKHFPEYFQEEVSFIQVSGAFSYCSWTGYNSNFGNGAYYNDFININTETTIPIRLNFANVCLENYDFNDNMANAILETNNNGSNLIEISNLELMDYIVTNYPNYKFVFSKQADLISTFSIDLLNQLTEFKKFDLIGLPDYLNGNFDFLNQLKHKNKYEITVNPICPASCKNYNKCLLNEHLNQLEYSDQQPQQFCFKRNPFGGEKGLITLKQIKEQYSPLGFSHFTFAQNCIPNLTDVFGFYLKYFIKPEYIPKVYKMWAEKL